MAYVVKNEGSWVLFTKSNYLLNRALLNRGLGVFVKLLLYNVIINAIILFRFWFLGTHLYCPGLGVIENAGNPGK